MPPPKNVRNRRATELPDSLAGFHRISGEVGLHIPRGRFDAELHGVAHLAASSDLEQREVKT